MKYTNNPDVNRALQKIEFLFPGFIPIEYILYDSEQYIIINAKQPNGDEEIPFVYNTRDKTIARFFPNVHIKKPDEYIKVSDKKVKI